MPTYDLYRLVKEELKNGSNDLLTRRSGRVIRTRIERDIAQEENGAVLALDFSGIGVTNPEGGLVN